MSVSGFIPFSFAEKTSLKTVSKQSLPSPVFTVILSRPFLRTVPDPFLHEIFIKPRKSALNGLHVVMPFSVMTELHIFANFIFSCITGVTL